MTLGHAAEAGAPAGPACRVEHVTTVAQLETVGRLRWTVFSEAIGYSLAHVPAMREITGFDVCPETNHFLAYIGDEPVGALRLILPSSSFAEWHRIAIGLPMAMDVAFARVPVGSRLAELGRSAVCRPYRGRSVVGHLMRAAYVMSRSRGVTHWVAASLTGTDCAIEATIIDDLLARGYGRSPSIDMIGNRAPPQGYIPRRALFDSIQRLRAADGDIAGLSLPRSLSVHLHCGARVAGQAYFDRSICEFMVPLVFDLDEYAASSFGCRYSDNPLLSTGVPEDFGDGGGLAALPERPDFAIMRP